MRARVTILGSGTSSGVPVIGCGCEVCTSADPRNRRWRPSAMLEHDDSVVLIDTSTDLRAQALKFAIRRVDAVLYTHEHADHVLGLDELRIFNARQRSVIPCYGPERALAAIWSMFSYVFRRGTDGGPRPRIELHAIDGPLEVVDGLVATPVPVLHGDLPIFAYRLGRFAYVTDCSRIPESSFGLLEGLEVLVLGALRYRPHRSHFSIEQAIATAAKIGATRTLLTHLTHDVDHGNVTVQLPSGVELAHDGLAFDLA